MLKNKALLSIGLTCVASQLLLGCGDKGAEKNTEQVEQVKAVNPADKFDLTQWKMNIPTDANNDGKVDAISVPEMQSFSHPDFFYLNDEGHMVFTTPNKAFTTPNSSNTRSELHQVIGGVDAATEDDPKITFTIKSNKRADEYAEIGGNLKATLKVNHVAKRAKYANKYPAYSVVVGQIHAAKSKTLVEEGEGYGFGNEPLKIYFKKWPDHEYGSVFWNYERNLAKEDPNRIDISYPVWGNDWSNAQAPKEAGIKLDEVFSYEVNVYGDVMELTFTTERHGTKTFEINLANNVDANGEVDELDSPNAYKNEPNFFKAGAYNQCSTKDDPGFWYAACLGTGDWETDKANGDYTQVTFIDLALSKGKPLK